MSLDTHSLERRGARNAEQRPARKEPARAARPSDATGKLTTVLQGARARASATRTSSGIVQRAMATPAALRRSYLKMLAPAHRLLRDRHVEKLLFKPTPAPLAKPASAAAPEPIYDGPIPGQVLDWVIAELDVTLRECAFVDFRAGHARTLLYAAMHDFERVIGYEYTQAAYEDAQLNISQFPRTYMKCRDVEIRRGDQGDVVIPDQPLVLFFPNAGKERFLTLMLDHVAASYRTNPRRIYVIMENAAEMPGFMHDDIFQEARLPVATRLKLRLFSPVDIRLFRSLA